MTVLIVFLLFGGNYFCSVSEDILPTDLIGEWEYDKVVKNDMVINADRLNECGYKEVLEINGNKIKEEFYFSKNKSIVGDIIGLSNKKVCMVDPITYEYRIASNSCNTQWLMLSNNSKRIVMIGEMIATEYEIEKLSEKSLILIKVNDLINFGVESLDRIEFIKMNK